MDPNHRAWNDQQHALQNALSEPEIHPEWLALFLLQHAQVHSGDLTNFETWSFEDDLLRGMDEAAMRTIPSKCEHSIAWILWHLARCEDLTMNILLAGANQILERQGWIEKLHSPFLHTGNLVNVQEIVYFSRAIDPGSVKAYRQAVGKATRQAVNKLNPAELSQKVRPERMEKVVQLGAVLDPGILDYWSHRTIAGLLLMPPTRHCFTHLNEALRINKALRI